MKEEAYVHGHTPAVIAAHTWRTAENSAEYLLPKLTPGMTLLDVGCGPGTITRGLASRVSPGKVLGIDASQDAIDKAREAPGLPANVSFEQANVYELECEDASFDVVHAHQLLQHLGDPVAALREMRRVTKPGGFVAAQDADYAAMVWYPEHPALEEWQELYRRTARSTGADPDAGRKLLSWAHRADFNEVSSDASTWCYAGSAATWWAGIWADRTLTSFGPRALGAGFATEADLRRIAEGWREWGRDDDAWFTILHGNILAHVK